MNIFDKNEIFEKQFQRAEVRVDIDADTSILDTRTTGFVPTLLGDAGRVPSIYGMLMGYAHGPNRTPEQTAARITEALESRAEIPQVRIDEYLSAMAIIDAFFPDPDERTEEQQTQYVLMVNDLQGRLGRWQAFVERAHDDYIAGAQVRHAQERIEQAVSNYFFGETETGSTTPTAKNHSEDRTTYVGEGIGSGTGGRGIEENHSFPSATGYSSRGVHDLDGPELAQKASDESRQREEQTQVDGDAGLEGDASDTDFADRDQQVDPILLDLDGNGLSVTEVDQSTHFVDGGDGLLHRTAWAAAGDGVLFFDAGNDGLITEKREFVFTEWDPGATSDLEAIRAVFDTNNDGKLTAADAAFASFKVMVTNADGTTSALTLAQLGITEIDLRGDATRIELPDGSIITGKTEFTRIDGTKGTVGDMTLAAEADGYRVDQTQSTDGSGNLVRVFTHYESDGSIRSTLTSVVTPGGAVTTNNYDDNGDGVVDRVQVLGRSVAGDGTLTETVQNYKGADVVSGVLENAKVTTTSADGKTITIQRDNQGGGWYDEIETRVIAANGAQTITISAKAKDGGTIRSTSETVSADGQVRTERLDEDGNGTFERIETHTISLNAGIRTELTEVKNSDGSVRSRYEEVFQADGRSRVLSHDRDGDGTFELVEDIQIVVDSSGESTTVIDRFNADQSLRSSSTTHLSADARIKTLQSDLDGDGVVDRVTETATSYSATGDLNQTVTVHNADGSVRSIKKEYIANDKVGRQSWIDLDQDGILSSDEKVSETTVDGASGVVTRSNWERNADGSINSHTWTVTSASGLISTSRSDENFDGIEETTTVDSTVVAGDGSATRIVSITNQDGSGRETTTHTYSVDGQTVATSRDIDGNGSIEAKALDQTTTLFDGTVRREISHLSGDNTLLARQQVDRSGDRRVTVTRDDIDGDGQWDNVTTRNQDIDGETTTEVEIFAPNGSLVSGVTTIVSADGLFTMVYEDRDGDGLAEREEVSTTIVQADGTRTTTTAERNGDGSLRAREQHLVSDDGLTITRKTDADGDGTYERVMVEATTLKTNGATEVVTSLRAADNTLLRSSEVETSDDGLVVIRRVDRDGDGTDDLVDTETTVLEADGDTVVTRELRDGAGALREAQVTTTSDNGRYETSTQDIDGNGTIDRSTVLTVGMDGTRLVTESTYDAAGVLQSRVEVETSGTGLSQVTREDRDGDGLDDYLTHRTTVLNTEGSRTDTSIRRAADATIIGTEVRAVSDDGLSVELERDLDNDGVFETRVVETKSVAQDGSVSEISEVYAIGLTVDLLNPVPQLASTLVQKTTKVTSGDGQTVTTSTDINGDSHIDTVVITERLTDGSQRETMRYLATSGAILTEFVTTTSADGLTISRTATPNSPLSLALSLTDVTEIAQDGEVTRDVVYNSNHRILEVSSDDGMTRTRSMDTDGNGQWDTITIRNTVFEADGDVVETATMTNGAGVLRGSTSSTTSGNGLVRSISQDLTGDGVTNRISTRTETGTGEVTQTEAIYDRNGVLVREQQTSVSADGRVEIAQYDRDGDGVTDLTKTDALNADQAQLTTYDDAAARGLLGSSVTQKEAANGQLIEKLFDFEDDGLIDVRYLAETSYSANGDKVTSTVEHFANGTIGRSSIATEAANGLEVVTTRDIDGDGATDFTVIKTIEIRADGSRFTDEEARYADGTLRGRTTLDERADGRFKVKEVDINGDGAFDYKVQWTQQQDGSMLEWRYAPNSGSLYTKTVSADGLVEVHSLQATTHTLTYNPLGNGSYGYRAYRPSTDPQEPAYLNSLFTYEVDDLGVATWTAGPRAVTLTVEQRAIAEEEAARIYDTLLDRDMNDLEVEMLVNFISRGVLDGERLADTLIGRFDFVEKYGAQNEEDFIDAYFLDTYDRLPTSLERTSAQQQLSAIGATGEGGWSPPTGINEWKIFVQQRDRADIQNGDPILAIREFDARYSGIADETRDSEFIDRIYQNALHRAPSMAELNEALAALNDPSSPMTRAQLAVELAESGQHLLQGNVHGQSNNYDVLLKPAELERIQDESYARYLVQSLFDVIFDRPATVVEEGYYAGLLQVPEPITMPDLARRIIDQSVANSSASIQGLAPGALVLQALENAFGRPVTTAEAQLWIDHLTSGSLEEDHFIAALAQSIEHRTVGNGNSAATGGGVTTHAGTTGNDTLYGDSGQDIMFGDDGNDALNGHAGDDTLNGGSGNDTMDGGAGDDLLNGHSGRDLIYGGDGNDTIIGGPGQDTVHGGEGHDLLWGYNHDDEIYGGNGNDTLYGDAGNDILSGGDGADYFVFEGFTSSGADTILDFDLDEDVIQFSGIAYSDLSFASDPTGLEITWTNGSILLSGITEASLSQDHFQFV